MSDGRYIVLSLLGEEGSGVYLLIAAETGRAIEDCVGKLFTEEHLSYFIGLFSDINVLKEIGVDGFGDEPGVYEGYFIIGIVSVVSTPLPPSSTAPAPQ